MGKISELFTKPSNAQPGIEGTEQGRSLRERFNGLADGMSREQMLLLVRVLALGALVCAVVYGYIFYKNITG